MFCQMRRLWKQSSVVCTRSYSLLKHYKAQVVQNRLIYDDKQYLVLRMLQALLNKLKDYQPIDDSAMPSPTALPSATNASVTTEAQVEKVDSQSSIASPITPIVTPKEVNNIKGFYLYGEVGSGKTFLMDMFYDNCQIQFKRRVHFHKFLLEIHQRIHNRKQELLALYGRDVNINLSSERDAITYVAGKVAKEAWLLCFDEFQVTDIADALILNKFFHELWLRGTILVATSNRPPADLYKNGLNRQYFLPFIKNLEEKYCVVHSIGSSKDYRSDTVNRPDVYYYPLTAQASGKLWGNFNSIQLHSTRPASDEVQRDVNVSIMMGRSMQVPFMREIAYEAGQKRIKMAWAPFNFLCEFERGAADYKALCASCDAIFIDEIPRLSILEHDKGRRFITLIDEIYDSGTLLYWVAETKPNELFKQLATEEINDTVYDVDGGRHFGTDHKWSSSTSCVIHAVTTKVGIDSAQDELKILEGQLSSIQELGFAFKRASSRLNEISSVEYYNNWLKKRFSD